MKIAVNLLPFRQNIAGAGKYAQKIIYELSKIDTQNDYYLFVSEQGKINFKVSSENFHFQTAKFNPESIFRRIFWEQFIFPFKLKKLNPDIIFTPSVAIPFLYKGRFLTTIHDLAYKKSKGKYSLLRRFYVKLVTIIAVRKSSIIFTVSNFSKEEIVREFSLVEKNVVVTYNGVNEDFFKEFTEKEKSVFKNKFNLPGNYMLYVGAIEPGKNLDKLFKAFAEFVKDYNAEYYLVLTSGIGWKKELLVNQIRELGIKDKIIFLPYIPENDLPLLYKCSKMLLYLSSYEGFGIPVLEALAAGTPVITSKSIAILEFAGKAILSVNPENINEIINGILKVIKDNDFIKYKLDEGKIVAQKFRWSNSAEIIYNYLTEELLN
jgi:glycosyltransferase involved in cell wall biosynthesis